MRLFALIFVVSSFAYGLVTAYVTFDHPEGWRCELSQGVWICQSSVETDRKESVVMSIATMATEWDTLDNYEKYLKEPRQIQDDDGNAITSKVSYSRRRNINGHMWVDSLQMNSELPGFWARYLVTTHTAGQTKLAILITYIVSEDKYKQMAPQFERMVSSLKPNAEFDLNIASKQGDGPLPGSQKLGQLQKNILLNALNIKKKPDEKKTAPPAQSPLGTIGAVVGGAVVILWILRRRRNRKSASRKEPTIDRKVG